MNDTRLFMDMFPIHGTLIQVSITKVVAEEKGAWVEYVMRIYNPHANRVVRKSLTNAGSPRTPHLDAYATRALLNWMCRMPKRNSKNLTAIKNKFAAYLLPSSNVSGAECFQRLREHFLPVVNKIRR